MKGGIAAMLVALDLLKREDVRLQGDVLFATNTDEESSGAGGYALVQHGVKADAGICAEPSGQYGGYHEEYAASLYDGAMGMSTGWEKGK